MMLKMLNLNKRDNSNHIEYVSFLFLEKHNEKCND